MPLVIALVLFAIIFVVIKCTTIRHSTRPSVQSGVNEVCLQPLPPSVEVPPTTQFPPSGTEVDTSLLRHPHPVNDLLTSHEPSQPSVLNTEPVSPPYSESQGVTSMPQGDGPAQL